MPNYNSEFFENSYSYIDIIEQLKSELNSLHNIFTSADVPYDFEYYTYLMSFEDDLNETLNLINNYKDNMQDIIDAWYNAERSAYEVAAELTLPEGTTFYENSAGGGRSGYVGNQYTSPDQEFTVNYIAIYVDGQFKANIGIDDNITVEEKIAQLKKDGIIQDDSNITISRHIATELEDGTLGDIGWLAQETYSVTPNKATTTETGEEETVTFNNPEIYNANDTSNLGTSVEDIGKTVTDYINENGKCLLTFEIKNKETGEIEEITFGRDEILNGNKVDINIGIDTNQYTILSVRNASIKTNEQINSQKNNGKIYSVNDTSNLNGSVEDIEKTVTDYINENGKCLLTFEIKNKETGEIEEITFGKDEILNGNKVDINNGIDTNQYTILSVRNASIKTNEQINSQKSNSQIYSVNDTSNLDASVGDIEKTVTDYINENGKCLLTFEIKNKETGEIEEITFGRDEILNGNKVDINIGIDTNQYTILSVRNASIKTNN